MQKAKAVDATVIVTRLVQDLAMERDPELHMDALDRHTTVIILGDGRSNDTDPRMIVFLARNRRRIEVSEVSIRLDLAADDGDRVFFASCRKQREGLNPVTSVFANDVVRDAEETGRPQFVEDVPARFRFRINRAVAVDVQIPGDAGDDVAVQIDDRITRRVDKFDGPAIQIRFVRIANTVASM